MEICGAVAPTRLGMLGCGVRITHKAKGPIIPGCHSQTFGEEGGEGEALVLQDSRGGLGPIILHTTPTNTMIDIAIAKLGLVLIKISLFCFSQYPKLRTPTPPLKHHLEREGLLW